MKNNKIKANPGTLKRLMSYVTKDYKKELFFVFVLILISVFTSVASSLFTKTLIDDYIIPMLTSKSNDFTALAKAILIMAGICIVGAGATYLYLRKMVFISQGVLRKIRNEMFEKMQSLPINYFDTNAYGDIMSRYTNDTDALEVMIAQALPQFISSGMTMLAILVAMISINIPLTIFVILFVFLITRVTKFIAGNSGKYFKEQQKSLGKLNGYIEEMINGQKVIKVFTHEEETKEEFDKLNEELCKNMTKGNTFVNILMPILSNLGNLQYIFIAIIGGALSINGMFALTVGKLVSFMQLSRGFTQPIMQTSAQINSVVLAIAGASRIFELLDTKSEENDGKVELVNTFLSKNNHLRETNDRTGNWAWKKTNGDLVELKGDVVFNDVDFAYGEKNVLFDIRMYARPGQKVALVGATGAGKTTITNLINRFYDIKHGNITYDGIDLREIDKNSLRKSLGIVLQETNLFTGTIKDNIKYGKENATDEEVINAAKIANAHDFISKLPKGYDTQISGNGESLSQGQKQLISIARAAINNPPVMILDEATSSIDTRTEKLVQDGMDKLMNGRTVFVIAHRLSTIRNSDVIMVMDHGKIIERGSHDELMAKKGQYYKLYTGVFELE